MKRILAPILAAALIVSCLACPVSAAFPDVTDPAVSEAAEVLRLLGIVNGAPDGNYYPNGTFTRAEFCKMALTALGRQAEAEAAAGRVIFTDVTAAHWALGYVNAAAAVTDGAEPLVRGRGAGRFEPDAPITWGEAVTILLRALGYGESDLGALEGKWYGGAMVRAKSSGLLSGLEADGGDTISRGEAARLFENLLFTSPKGSGQIFLAQQMGGSISDSVLLLDAKGKALAGGAHTVVTDGGVYRTFAALDPALVGTVVQLVLDGDGNVLTALPGQRRGDGTGGSVTDSLLLVDLAGKALAAGGHTLVTDGGIYRTELELAPELLGTRAKLVLDGNGDVLALIPDEEAAVRTVRIAAAESRYLSGGEERIPMSASLPVYRDSEVLGAYGELYATRAFSAGVRALLCLDKTDSVYAIFLLDQAVEAPGEPALTGVYQSAAPGPLSPSTITVLDHEFPVLDSALPTLSAFRPGDVITLVLDSRGAVTAVLDPEAAVAPALGVVSFEEGMDENGKTIWTATAALAMGFTVSGRVSAPTKSELKNAAGRVAGVWELTKGELTLTYPENTAVSGDWNIARGTLGTTQVSNRVAVYDRVGSGPLVPVSAADLTLSAIPGDRITYVHVGENGVADLLVLDNVTGDGYTYGILSRVDYVRTWVEDMELSNPAVFLRTAEGEVPFIEGETDFTDELGAFYGMAPSMEEVGGTPRLEEAILLKRVPGVRRTAFENGTALVEGMTFPVAEDVFCWNAAAERPFASLEEALAYSVYVTVYYDRTPGQGGKIRAVSVG